MNTETKTEWRLVPVDATQEMMRAMDESSPATYWRRCPWKAALNAAPTPPASEPVGRFVEDEFNGVGFVEFIPFNGSPLKDGDLLYREATPCERCAELDGTDGLYFIKAAERVEAGG